MFLCILILEHFWKMRKKEEKMQRKKLRRLQERRWSSWKDFDKLKSRPKKLKRVGTTNVTLLVYGFKGEACNLFATSVIR